MKNDRVENMKMQAKDYITPLINAIYDLHRHKHRCATKAYTDWGKKNAYNDLAGFINASIKLLYVFGSYENTETEDAVIRITMKSLQKMNGFLTHCEENKKWGKKQ